MSKRSGLTGEERVMEAHRLREVWHAALPGSRPMKPWHLQTEEQRTRWLALADDSLSRSLERAILISGLRAAIERGHMVSSYVPDLEVRCCAYFGDDWPAPGSGLEKGTSR